MAEPRAASQTVAILPWGDVFADWLDPLGVTLDALRDEFTGSWMFGYVEALRTAGVRSVIVCVTDRVGRHTRWTHRPTEVTMHLLPPSPLFRSVRGLLLRQGLGERRDLPGLARAAVTHLAPYLTTPPARLARVLRAESCTTLLCQEYETPRFDVCVALGAALRMPVFATFQGGDYQLSRLEGQLRPLALRRATGLIVPASSERQRLRQVYGVSEQKLSSIFNPVDVRLWRPGARAEGRAELGIAPEAEVVVWHGQIHPRKGLDLLLDAWARVRAERPNRPLKLVLVGSGEARGALASRLTQPGIRLVDEWVLDPARLRRLLCAGDVYAFPSRHEGLAVAPVEAMACGLPVVATSAQGMADILEVGQKHGGVLVPRDDLEGFGAALGSLLDDPARRTELGRRARQRVESAFSFEAVGDQLRAFLDAGRRR